MRFCRINLTWIKILLVCLYPLYRLKTRILSMPPPIGQCPFGRNIRIAVNTSVGTVWYSPMSLLTIQPQKPRCPLSLLFLTFSTFITGLNRSGNVTFTFRKSIKFLSWWNRRIIRSSSMQLLGITPNLSSGKRSAQVARVNLHARFSCCRPAASSSIVCSSNSR